MTTHTLDIPVFRELFPAFSNDTLFPDAKLELWWGMATVYLGGGVDGPLFSGAGMQSALNFMTAHLLQLSTWADAGEPIVVMRGSTVDKVQVQLEPPPFKNGWQFWLSTTPYGLMLWALLRASSAGGLYASSGIPERMAFRRAGGGFGPRVGFRR